MPLSLAAYLSSYIIYLKSDNKIYVRIIEIEDVSAINEFCCEFNHKLSLRGENLIISCH